MVIESVPFVFRILDFLLIPFMFILSGFNLERPQETHPWHEQKVDCAFLDSGKGVEIIGNDKSKVDNRSLLMHMPLLGGWKNYAVLEASGYTNHWHVAWKIEYFDKSRETLCEIQKLPITDSRIKILTGIGDSKGTGYALNEKSEFIEIKKVDEGVLGDGKYRTIRLF